MLFPFLLVSGPQHADADMWACKATWWPSETDIARNLLGAGLRRLPSTKKHTRKIDIKSIKSSCQGVLKLTCLVMCLRGCVLLHAACVLVRANSLCFKCVSASPCSCRWFPQHVAVCHSPSEDAMTKLCRYQVSVLFVPLCEEKVTTAGRSLTGTAPSTTLPEARCLLPDALYLSVFCLPRNRSGHCAW